MDKFTWKENECSLYTIISTFYRFEVAQSKRKEKKMFKSPFPISALFSWLIICEVSKILWNCIFISVSIGSSSSGDAREGSLCHFTRLLYPRQQSLILVNRVTSPCPAQHPWPVTGPPPRDEVGKGDLNTSTSQQPINLIHDQYKTRQLPSYWGHWSGPHETKMTARPFSLCKTLV